MKTLDDLKQELTQDPDFVREYEALEPEYQIARQLIALRLARGLTQSDLAARAGTRQVSVSRVETTTTTPTLPLLKKLAQALDAHLEIRLVPDEFHASGAHTEIRVPHRGVREQQGDYATPENPHETAAEAIEGVAKSRVTEGEASSLLVGRGNPKDLLNDEEIQALTCEALDRADLAGKRVLVIIPDGTRTAPIPLFFRLFHEQLWGRVAALDYLVALGTHQPMSEEALNRLVGVTAEERRTTYAGVNVFNHRWDLPGTLVQVGTIPAAEIERLSNGLLVQDVAVTLNRMIFDYDQLIVCGPVFPHEVVGFSGGNKYFFPGISGPEVINFTHWLGALITSYEIIGTKHTPVRAVINRAASFIDVPKLCFAQVVTYHGLAGLYMGSPEEAWEAAADLSAQVHVAYVDRPFRRVLSIMPEMYDDLWTAAKGMYKMEPAIADGGEVVIYAPHLTEISYTHGHVIDQVGYHVRDYFVKQWDRFRDYPWGVLAHSTHLRGLGTYDAETGEERPRIDVTLATGIPRERCERVNLGYLDPAEIDVDEWRGREDEGILVVPKAGEMLYHVRK
jgi:nickel-dependent lactate racemase/DNA-binding XRE family transcriptional regulator